MKFGRRLDFFVQFPKNIYLFITWDEVFSFCYIHNAYKAIPNIYFVEFISTFCIECFYSSNFVDQINS